MKKSSHNLPTSDQKLEAALQAFSDINMLLDTNGVILDYKSGAFLPDTFPQITPKQRIQDVFSPELKEKFEHALDSVQKKGNASTIEYSLLIAGREHWFDARLVPASNSRIVFT